MMQEAKYDKGTHHEHVINIYEWNMQKNYDNVTSKINTRQQRKINGRQLEHRSRGVTTLLH